MNQMTRAEERIQKAFQLAYFIHGNRTVAKQIAVSAMNKLEVAATAQFKRMYYTPTGRSDSARAARSKVSLSDLQLLQRLVYVESEAYEKQKEKEKTASNEDLLIHFIKHLVRITLKRNSFYVTLAMSRIMRTYGTNETMEIYNTVIQDPERVHDDYYYRSRKGQLMKELKERFGDLLMTTKGQRGEERFQSQDGSEELASIVKDCLDRFTPWSSSCSVPDKFDPYSDVIGKLSFDGRDPDDEHRIEVNRIHATLHPHCFCKLVKSLKLDDPEEKLEIPKFAMDQQNDSSTHGRGNPPSLNEDELQTIKNLLSAQAESRRAASSGLLRVIVDGNERVRLNPNETASVEFELEDDAELIEVRIVEKSGDALLATHLLSFDDLQGGAGPQQASIVLEGGQKLSFNFAPTKNAAGEITGAHCGVAYEETVLLKRAAMSWRRFKFAHFSRRETRAFLKPALAFGLLLIACIAGFFVYLQTQKREGGMVKTTPTPTPKVEQNLPTPAPSVERQNPGPGQDKKNDNRTAPRQRQEKKELAPQPKNEAPVGQQQPTVAQNNQRQPPVLPTTNEIARVAVFGDKAIKDGTRNGTSGPQGLKLSEIKMVFIKEIKGDKALGRQIREALIRELSPSGRFKIVNDDNSAESSVNIIAKRDAKSGRVIVTVNLSNGIGEIIWPIRKGVKSWKYVGPIELLPKRIASDLVSDAGK
jgi:hypothetical protein